MRITRIHAARRQLQCAVQMWFAEGDAISTHTLTGAAYQIIHDLNHKAKGSPLLYDSPGLTKESAKRAVSALKAHLNFFKHADVRKARPSDAIDFDPSLTELFVLASLLGTEHLGNVLIDIESAFVFWCMLHRSDWIVQEAIDEKFQSFNPHTVTGLRGLHKSELLKVFIDSRQMRRESGIQ